jgi:curved DNA-binding protein CbpA
MKIQYGIVACQIIALGAVSAFCPPNFSTQIPAAVNTPSARKHLIFTPSPDRNIKTQLHAYNTDSSYLLDEFRTADGEIINPYRVLKVGRHADRKEIKQSYRNLSKKYHPDGARFREVLPGCCNDLNDVRDQWERIKLSYEILSDKKRRIKYDRHSALDDPAAAFGRMSMDILGWGMTALAKGALQIGDMAAHNLENNQGTGKKPDPVSHRKTYKSRRPNNHPIRFARESNMAIQNNALLFAPPANGFNMDFGVGQVEEFLSNDAFEEVKKTTLITLSWGMFALAKSLLSLGESATNHASMMI